LVNKYIKKYYEVDLKSISIFKNKKKDFNPVEEYYEYSTYDYELRKIYNKYYTFILLLNIKMNESFKKLNFYDILKNFDNK
jgi:hypothetical protein